MKNDKLQNSKILEKNINNPQRDETYQETLDRWKWFDDEDGLVSKPIHYDDAMVNKVDTWDRFKQVKKDMNSEEQGKKMTNHINKTLNTYENKNLPIEKIKDRKNNPHPTK